MKNFQQDFIQRHLLPSSYLTQAEQYFQPVLAHIYTTFLAHQAQNKQDKSNQNPNNQDKSQQPPLFIGINGCQGSGKSTLADYLTTMLNHHYKLSAIRFSLDDFYLSQAERLQLAKTIHPLFKTRGVPASHNIALLTQTLNTLAQNKGALAIPIFDKSIDNPKPQSQWQTMQLPVDIVIVEGWCWGTPAQTEQTLLTPINQLEQEFDQQAIWRRYVNQQIQQYYQPLYDEMNIWIMLKALSFACVKQWRLEQEQKLTQLHAITHKKHLMNSEEIKQFIQYFQRLTEHSLQVLPAKMDFCFSLNKQRKIIA